jgi:sulfofructosephosphate aldolase
MVAMDQRDSLRTMLRDRGLPDGPEPVQAFKLAVARELAPLATGFLIDSEHVDAVARLVPRGLILAVDVLVQQPGGPVEDTRILVPRSLPAGVVAIKLLVIWRDDEHRNRRLEMARRFVSLAASRGVLSVLEGVVRDDAEIATAAAELGEVGPSLYKCQVPLRGRGDPAAIEHRAREIDAVLPCPWVVLSQGVDPADFPAAVRAACHGGASGMLAGRAVWTAALGGEDPAGRLHRDCAPRLRELAAIVAEHGRPVAAPRAGRRPGAPW